MQMKVRRGRVQLCHRSWGLDDGEGKVMTLDPAADSLVSFTRLWVDELGLGHKTSNGRGLRFDGSNPMCIQEEVKMGKNDRSVYRRKEDGKWANKGNDASRPASLHDTQAEAEDAARQMLRNSGGGELTTMGKDGRIRSKDTIAPGRDPMPPRDTEH